MPTSLRYKRSRAGRELHSFWVTCSSHSIQILPTPCHNDCFFAAEATSSYPSMGTTSTGPSEPPPELRCALASPVMDAMATAPWATVSVEAALATWAVAMGAAFIGHGALALALATAPTDGPWLQMTTGPPSILCVQNSLKNNDCLPASRNT